MSRFNFNTLVFNLENKPIDNSELNKILANILIVNTPGIEPAKSVDWARELWKSGTLEIDRSDCESLKQFVKSEKCQLPNITKDAIFTILKQESKKEEPTPKKGVAK